jgi:NAD+ synthase (glutamine-hydrolysing)
MSLRVGDIAHHVAQIEAWAHEAYAQGAHVLLTPELAICGYSPQDALLDPRFIQACEASVGDLAHRLRVLPGFYVVLGHPQALLSAPSFTSLKPGKPCAWNAATVWCEGQKVAQYAKQHLPCEQVFNEPRYFVPGHEACVFTVRGHRLGLLICQDAWVDAPCPPHAFNPAQAAQRAGAQLLCVLNASPFAWHKPALRWATLGQRAQETGLPLIYAHQVGGQDDWVFDGGSFVVDAQGQLQGQAPAFEPALWTVHFTPQVPALNLQIPPPPPPAPSYSIEALKVQELPALESLWRALVLGLRDYVRKNGFPGVVLGLSGGIDSALVLVLAVDALGPDRVQTVMMPSPYTAAMSIEDAQTLAKRLGVSHRSISIEPLMAGFADSLAPIWQAFNPDQDIDQAAHPQHSITAENLQARIRGTLLMALANDRGWLLLSTGNKSELATGYCTLYGDMAGGFAPIKDVLKTQVFALARWRNAHDPYNQGLAPIPSRIIDRPPSAELRPDQTDQDSLPPYPVLDACINQLMGLEPPAWIEGESTKGDCTLSEPLIQKYLPQVQQLMKNAEHKRRQAPLGTRVSHRAFGTGGTSDWQMPLSCDLYLYRP